ncbi:hypothetical protein GQ600_26417 [Phytophthora cactorum]|nr:hypothetical protein GQ600_26417 [Phytophthora cactorum]
MASNPVGEFITKLMASKSEGEKETLEHLSKLAEGAKWRLDDDLPAHKKVGFHRHHQYTSPEGFPEVPRQYIVTRTPRARTSPRTLQLVLVGHCRPGGDEDASVLSVKATAVP